MHTDDEKELQAMGYKQELLRSMNGFSNFAISFSIICILAGGITSLQLGISSVGGAAIGLGWPLSCLFSLLIALAMGQIASAFPTAGGLYHWAAILGGRWWGWVTAWFNVVGLVTVLSAINVGLYLFILGSLHSLFGFSVETLGEKNAFWIQSISVTLITVIQALFNYRGIKITTKLTDLSGYLIFFISTTLTIAFFIYSPKLDFSRLITFTNYSGELGGNVWPKTDNMLYLFCLGFLLPAYTITGFDASAHTAEETINASTNVPKGMVRSVLYSGLFGWLMLIAITVALPSLDAGAAQGGNIFFWLMDSLFPFSLKIFFLLGIIIAQFLCGLATLTSTSRMFFAFARDGGLPFSNSLKVISPKFKTPGTAIWVASLLVILFSIYTPVYSTITVVCVIFLYVSYVLPIALGLIAYQRSWTKMGSWSMGFWFRPVAIICILGCSFILYIGVQPPNDKALTITLGAILLTLAIWFSYERKRFKGPPPGIIAKKN